MSIEAWATVVAVLMVMALLARGRVPPDIAMVAGLTALLLLGVVPPSTAIAGFAHPAVVLIAALFVVAAGLRETGAVDMLARRLLGRPRSVRGAQLRLMLPVSLLSGFLNNTAVVALYLPILNQWARSLHVSPSKLLMPLSFAANLGGKLSTIGTASNVVVMTLFLAYVGAPANHGWLAAVGADSSSSATLFWGVAALGVPTVLVGTLFIAFAAPRLLPARKPVEALEIEPASYRVEMLVEPGSVAAGKSVETAGLRRLPGLFLAEIRRGETIFPAVAPEMRLQEGDRLSFVGDLGSVADLSKIPGVVPTSEAVREAHDAGQRAYSEAVVSHASPLVGRSVRDAEFRTVYNAAILAVRRGAERLSGKIGDIVLQPGDVLLLEAHAGFSRAYRRSRAFYVVSRLNGARSEHDGRAIWALGILVLLVVGLSATQLGAVAVGLACALLMIAARCVTAADARSSINWQVLITIGAALGLGAALQHTGAAGALAQQVLALTRGAGPHVALLSTFLLAVTLSIFITNNGAAVVTFPVVMTMARELHVSPLPFVMTLMVAAGSNYVWPATYQTHLMVWGAGGYRLQDFARLGAPLTALLAVVCTLVAPLAFPF